MKLFTVVAALCFATPVSLQETYPLWYDTLYDQSQTSLSSVACSTGKHGLLTRGFETFGVLPYFPCIGGAPHIQSWDSPHCGSCWELSYTDANGVFTYFYFLAINVGYQGGFTISPAGMNALTNGNAQTLDGVLIAATQQPDITCGL